MKCLWGKLLLIAKHTLPSHHTFSFFSVWRVVLRIRRWRGRIGLRAAYSTSSLSLFQRSPPTLLASPFPNTTLSAMLKTPAGRVFLSFLAHPLHCPSRGLDVFLALIMAAQKEISLAKWPFASIEVRLKGP